MRNLERALDTLGLQHKVEVLDYRIWRREWREYIKLLLPLVRLNTGQAMKTRHLRKWLASQVSFSKHTCWSEQPVRIEKWLKKGQWDVLVVGSDTVWSVSEKNELPVPPNVYFLPFDVPAHRIALAVSADRHDASLYQEPHSKNISEALSKFDWIAARDQSTSQLLQSLGAEHEMIADPTIIYGVSNLVPEEAIAPDLGHGNKPILGIAIGDNRKRNEAARYFETRGWHIFNMLGDCDGSDVDSSYLRRPFEEKLSIIRGRLSGIVTDRFHAAIFALSLGDYPVAVLQRPGSTDGVQGKAEDLLQRLGCENALVNMANEQWLALVEGQLQGDPPIKAKTNMARMAEAGQEQLTRALRTILKPEVEK
ncbi:MAG: polysaccharide pyruvyl transferase family protein [Saccharospirillum sp.]|nr:polysaccharide pyruvyl transferase family protein [Saccharospirillum sp.]